MPKTAQRMRQRPHRAAPEPGAYPGRIPARRYSSRGRARYLGALNQGHAGQLLELQTLVAGGAVERSFANRQVLAIKNFR
jgi:hypothetical protein